MTKNKVDIKTQKRKQYAEQINTWKSKYGKVKAFFLSEDEDTQVIFFRQPTRQELAGAEKTSTEENGDIDAYKKSDRHIIDCYLGGDLTPEQIMNDTSIYLPLAKFVLSQLIDQKKSSWEEC